MRSAAVVVTHVEGVARESPLLVLPVGDALQEPFWPEGARVAVMYGSYRKCLTCRNSSLHEACPAPRDSSGVLVRSTRS